LVTGKVQGPTARAVDAQEARGFAENTRMKEFQELLGHVSALLDRQAISLAEASAILARFIQGEMECSG
jgi:hypothetical protein